MITNHHGHGQCPIISYGHAHEIINTIIYDGNENGREWYSVYNYEKEWEYDLKNIELGWERE